jgi:integrase/recombinase XerD
MVGSASGKQVDAEATPGGVRLLFDSLMMRGVVEYNPAARARPPRLVRESSQTPVFEEAEIVAFLDSISLESLKDVRDKAIFSVLLYSWCRVSALINLTVADYYERGGTRWLRFQENEGKTTRYQCTQRLKKLSIFGLNALT